MTNFEEIKADAVKALIKMTAVDFAAEQSNELECRDCVLSDKCTYTNKNEKGIDFPNKCVRVMGCARTLLDWLESEVEND